VSAGKVAVLLSGGVDSAVAAARLKAQGYDVHGYFLALTSNLAAQREGACCSPEDASDARLVADRLEIPFQIVNLERKFRTLVIEPYVRSYLAGETPNPCGLCNPGIKFGAFAKLVIAAAGVDFVATGHHARAYPKDDRWVLAKAKDRDKDQSYFLFGLSQAQLSRAIFPVGDTKKDELRVEAKRLGLAVSSKRESQDLCFVNPGRRKDLLKSLGGLDPGEIVDMEGRILGRHNGISGFTVGQRKGLGISSRKPLYVVRIDGSNRRVIVGMAEDLKRKSFSIRDYNHVSKKIPDETWYPCLVKVRYRSKPAVCKMKLLGEHDVRVELDEPFGPVAPGQAAVFYKDDEVIGGGWIAVPGH